MGDYREKFELPFTDRLRSKTKRPDAYTMIRIEPSIEQTNRSHLIAAFKRVIKRAGRCQATDLHVRRLLGYVQAKDVDGQGVQRSLEQLANKLFLNVSTCHRIIRRAAKHFGLLTIISQRHTPGGQTANRYSINWKNVDALLCNEDRENASVEKADLLNSRARSKRILPSSESTTTGSIHSPVRLAPQRASGISSDAPVFIEQADNTTASAAHTANPTQSRARSKRIPSFRSTSHRMLSPIKSCRTTLPSYCLRGSPWSRFHTGCSLRSTDCLTPTVPTTAPPATTDQPLSTSDLIPQLAASP